MVHHQRFLFPKPNASDCHAFCTDACVFYDLCPAPPPPPSPLPPPPLIVVGAGDDSNSSSITTPIQLHHASRLVPALPIVAASFVAAAFLLIALFALIRLRRRRRRLLQNAAPGPVLAPADGGGGDFFDDDGDVLDHHVWYIRTAGLDESTIGAITAWAYKAGDGILDSSSADCAVCLAEFRDGEILRLLPKCGHAFHLSCIDTWLRSHVNCPLCRAPIVAPKSTAYGGVGGGRGPSPPPSSQPSSAANQLDQNLSPASLIDGNQVVNWPSEAGQRGSEMEIDGASLELGVGNGRVVTLAPYSDLEVAIANGEVGIFQPIRRSASMDSLPFALELGERSSAERNKADLEEEQAQKNSKKQGNNSKGHTRTRSSILPL